jgi:hypothetical protein
LTASTGRAATPSITALSITGPRIKNFSSRTIGLVCALLLFMSQPPIRAKDRSDGALDSGNELIIGGIIASILDTWQAWLTVVRSRPKAAAMSGIGICSATWQTYMAICLMWQSVRRRSRRIWTRWPAIITISVVTCAAMRQTARIGRIADGGR